MNEQVVEQMQRLLLHLDDNRGRLVVDADVHATGIASLDGNVRQRLRESHDYFHGRPLPAEDILREMDTAQVDVAIVWLNPETIPPSGDASRDRQCWLDANRYLSAIACRYPERFIPGGWTDIAALGLDGALALAETLVTELGFAFVRFDPARMRHAIDSPPVLALIDRIVELGATPVTHFHPGSPYTELDGVERIVTRHSARPLVLVHSGYDAGVDAHAERARIAVRELGLKHANLKQVLSARPDSHMESDFIRHQLAEAPFHWNLLCASGAPFGRMTWRFGGCRAMLQSLHEGLNHTDERIRTHPATFDAASVRHYLGGNAVELTLESYLRVIEAQGVRLPPAEASPDEIS